MKTITKQKIADILYSHIKQMMGLCYISQNDVPYIADEILIALNSDLPPNKEKKEEAKQRVTVEERTIDILLDDTFSGHPSRESEYQIRNAIKFLAKHIDILHELRIKKLG